MTVELRSKAKTESLFVDPPLSINDIELLPSAKVVMIPWPPPAAVKPAIGDNTDKNIKEMTKNGEISDFSIDIEHPPAYFRLSFTIKSFSPSSIEEGEILQ